MAAKKLRKGAKEACVRRLSPWRRGYRVARHGRRVWAVIAVVLLLDACGSGATRSGKSSSKPLTSVTFELGFHPFGDVAGFYYAQAKGYYAAEGLKVTIIPGTGSATTAAELGAGKVDLAEPGAIPAMVTASKGAPLVAVGEWLAGNTFGVYVAKSTGITTLAGLAGKSVIAPPGSAQAILTPVALQQAGVNPSSVHMISISPAAMVSEYERGVGDALSTSLPAFITQIQAVRPSNLIYYTSLPNPAETIFTTNTYLKQNAGIIRKFLAASYRGLAGTYAHPQAAASDVANAVPGTSISEITAGISAYKNFICSPSMNTQRRLVGYVDRADMASSLSLAEKYFGAGTSLSLAKTYTDQFFSGGDPVSTTHCPL